MTRLGNIATQNFPGRRPAAILDFGRQEQNRKRYSLANNKNGFSTERHPRKVYLPTLTPKCLGMSKFLKTGLVYYECCIISPPCFLAECWRSRLNDCVAVFCIVCFFWIVFSLSVFFNLSSVPYFPACTDVNGTVQPNCADVPLRLYSLTHL